MLKLSEIAPSISMISTARFIDSLHWSVQRLEIILVKKNKLKLLADFNSKIDTVKQKPQMPGKAMVVLVSGGKISLMAQALALVLSTMAWALNLHILSIAQALTVILLTQNYC